MKGRTLGKLLTLALAPVFAVSFAFVAEAQQGETKDVARPPAKKKKPVLSKEAAEKRYQEARAMESKGNEKGALQAYLAAGEAGHGLAQKRLGEIYEKGNSATKRDYDTALRWYEKARAQGIEIPKPIAIQKGR